MKEYLVVGCGISGSSIANLLSKDNDVTIIDKRNTIAGNCYDYRDNNIMVHKYGSHIFHTSDGEVWDFVNLFASFNDYTHHVYAMVDGKKINLPFNLNSIKQCFAQSFSEIITKKLLDNYGYGSKVPISVLMEQKDDDLKILAQFVYEKIFLHYTEKQWGMNPKEIDSSVTARVPIFVSDDDRYFQDKHQGIPSEGYTRMIEKMLNYPNIKLRLNTDFKKINDWNRYDGIFYTGPLDELMDYCYGELPYRSIHFEIETHNTCHYQDNAVINYPNEHDYTRIHEYKYYLNDESDETIIAKEYPEKHSIGSNERYYPIPCDESALLYGKYLEEVKKRYPNMYFLGRLGDYRYYDMDKAIARAISVYREVCK